jgi:hypothetical protein
MASEDTGLRKEKLMQNQTSIGGSFIFWNGITLPKRSINMLHLQHSVSEPSAHTSERGQYIHNQHPHMYVLLWISTLVYDYHEKKNTVYDMEHLTL